MTARRRGAVLRHFIDPQLGPALGVTVIWTVPGGCATLTDLVRACRQAGVTPLETDAIGRKGGAITVDTLYSGDVVTALNRGGFDVRVMEST